MKPLTEGPTLGQMCPKKYKNPTLRPIAPPPPHPPMNKRSEEITVNIKLDTTDA